MEGEIISPNQLDTSLENKTSSNLQDNRKTPNRNHEEKMRIARERQNEERQKKIEELKAQAEAAQKYREQKEEERRRKIDELRSRDHDKRQQVEERKKAIQEAEKERREYILRRNQERESRLETKKRNDRSSIGFAFGSSTPRLLEPADFGSVSPSVYWGHRRSTSISNVSYTGAPLSRRSSERELSDGAKKRATSAGGAERNDDNRRKSSSMYEIFNWGYYSNNNSSSLNNRVNDQPPKRFQLSVIGSEINIDGPTLQQQTHLPPQLPTKPSNYFKEETVDSSHLYRSVARRKTDLMPTIPSPRDHSYFGSKSSLSNTPRTPGSRSGDVTPGGTSRPGSAMSTSTNLSLSGYVNRRSVPIARKPRPVSIAGTGVSLEEKQRRENSKPPTPSKTQSTPKRQTLSSSSSRVSSVERKTPIKKDFPTSTPQKSSRTSLQKSTSSEKLSRPRDLMSVSCIGKIENPRTKEEKNALNSNSIKTVESLDENTPTDTETTPINAAPDVVQNLVVTPTNSTDSNSEDKTESVEEKTDKGNEKEKQVKKETSRESSESRENGNDMTASMMAKKITTEEQAKAALAERRRLAREEAERQAELERQRLEAEHQAELQRQREEEERQRQFEEESNKMAQQARLAEEERLKQAIEEAKKREEAEKLKREEEERLKVEREEAEKKAKEDAEKQRIETAERLKKEEKEREERRKRVEAIMSRTRKSTAPASNSTPSKTQENDDNNKEVAPIAEVTSTPVSEETLIPQSPANDVETTNGSSENHTKTDEIKVEQPEEKSLISAQLAYEQSVTDKESALMNSFANMIIDENAKNVAMQNQTNTVETTDVVVTNNGKLVSDNNHDTSMVITHSATNGNGHFENINKKDSNILVDLPSTNQLIDVSNETSQQINFNNNNSLLANTATLVTADGLENKDISLL